jgi:hypothetical protein
MRRRREREEMTQHACLDSPKRRLHVSSLLKMNKIKINKIRNK